MTDKEQNYITRIIMYERIRKLRNEEHKSIQWIADYLRMNFRTVKKYLKMDQAEFESYSARYNERPCKLEPYTDFVVKQISKYQDTPAAQMHDLLKEHYPDFPKVSPKTVYNFVMKIRQEYGLPVLAISERTYQALPDSPPGKYAQVDFGQTKLRNGEGKRVRVYFFAMLLCHSRYKYVIFQDKPFTSETASLAHEKAFEYFKGVPKHIIYDQDAVFLYDENLGDYKMTEVFASYVKSRPFEVIFCRAEDPESKGKVENVVKYVKYNFLLNRQYSNLDNLNAEALAWLGRTGNAMVHGTTCKKPYEEWCHECKHLNPYIPLMNVGPSGGHKVLRTNSIRYRGNTYSLPLGTYKGPDTTVYLSESSGNLIVKDAEGHEITKHLMPYGSGNTIINRNHQRDRSVGIEEYRKRLIGMFSDETAAASFTEEINERYPRYMRDQMTVIHGCIMKYGQKAADETLALCMADRLFSATYFRDIIEQSAPKNDTDYPTIKPLSDERARMMANFEPGKSGIDVYNRLFNTSTHETIQ